MSFETPALSAVIEQVRTDFEANIPGADAHLRRSNLNVLSAVMGGGVHGLYGALESISRNLLPDTADEETVLRWASLWGLVRKAAVASTGSVVMQCVEDSVIPAGHVLARRDGVQYQVTTELTAEADGELLVEVAALEAGSAGNAIANTVLTLVTPIVGVASTATVDETDPLTGGADQESLEALRRRLLTVILSPAMAGAETDYLTWALAVPGVTRAWVYPAWLGLGTVGVTVAADGQSDPIPGDALVEAVQAALDAHRPVTARAIAFAPVRRALNPTIWLNPTSETIRGNVIAEITDLLQREVPAGGTLLLSHLTEAISRATGEVDHALQSPTDNTTVAQGELLVLGEVTWATV